jgi:hypothetical protein
MLAPLDASKRAEMALTNSARVVNLKNLMCWGRRPAEKPQAGKQPRDAAGFPAGFCI